MTDHDHLIETARQLGFANVEGKGAGVLEKFVTKRGETIRFLLLTSHKDATLLIYHEEGGPFKFQFKSNFRWAERFLREYLETQLERSEQHDSKKV